MDNKQRLLKDQKILRDEKNLPVVREIIERLGADPDEVLAVESEKNIKLLTRVDSIVKEIVGSEVWEKDKNGRYKIYTKMTAITVMMASLGMMEDFGVGTGEPMPHFAGVSRWLGIPADTLSNWWKNQKTILREHGALGYSAVQRMTLKQILLAEKYQDALELTDQELLDMRKTPKGLGTLMKLSTQLLFNARYLTMQGDVIASKHLQTVAPEKEGRFGVVGVIPERIEKPKKVLDAKFKDIQGKKEDASGTADQE